MRELEGQLGRMTAGQRGQVVEALRAIVGGAQRLSGMMGISRKATAALIGWLGVQMSMGKTLRELTALAKVKAQAVGPHVGDLFAPL